MSKLVDQGENDVLNVYLGSQAKRTTHYLGLFKNNSEGQAKWQASTAYNQGDLVEPTTPNGYVYQCTVAGTSGSSEPTWPTTIDDTVVDGTVTWKCLRICEPGDEARLPGMAAWQASTAYSQGDIVKPTTPNGFYYRCTVAGTSDTAEPTWPTELGATVVDGGVTWECAGVAIEEQTGANYSRLSLAQASWTITDDLAEYPQQTFEAGAAWGKVYGYFIAASADDSGPLLWVETFSDGPYDIQNQGDLIKITPKVRASG